MFSFSTEVLAAGMYTFDISNKVTIKKQCKKQKIVDAESEKLPATISTGASEVVNFQTISAICVTTTTPHFTTLVATLIPHFNRQNTLEIPKAYDSPSLLRDPFPPKV